MWCAYRLVQFAIAIKVQQAEDAPQLAPLVRDECLRFLVVDVLAGERETSATRSNTRTYIECYSLIEVGVHGAAQGVSSGLRGSASHPKSFFTSSSCTGILSLFIPYPKWLVDGEKGHSNAHRAPIRQWHRFFEQDRFNPSEATR